MNTRAINTSAERELEELVRKAGDILLSFWPGRPGAAEGPKLRTETKADGSFVSEADFASNDLLVPGLQRLFPGDAIVSEEGPHFEEKMKSLSRVWIIDPLDGTKCFINGTEDFSILIGLSVDSKIEYGIAYFPTKKLFGRAKRGEGAYVNDERLKVSASTKLRERSVFIRNFKANPHPAARDEWVDSGVAFFNLCRGECDGVIIRMSAHKEWDLAAPAVLIEESGGRLSDEHGQAIRFNQGKIGYRYLVASNGKCHDELLSLIPADS